MQWTEIVVSSLLGSNVSPFRAKRQDGPPAGPIDREYTSSATPTPRSSPACDGERPRCCECTARESACQYTETESTQTKRRRADVEELFELLRTLPEESAFELLARIRAGADTRELVETMQYGNLLVQFASASTAGSQDSQDNQQCSGGSST
ncbi:predicted protein [Plenodomus lingam JN3]|uniref:Predicted protein n=1 Tax=Leptosphaeria maculans (strain JN3 / isolate v23.1.3 / race Av1-4-5-6-7-8) TaxID=985895 RepID=E4ZN34_LEPMJ|nr:predicted protein [Plenodomus lingam JN3]CBX92637.1 predicted protein [Plenodomus lingam JN3]